MTNDEKIEKQETIKYELKLTNDSKSKIVQSWIQVLCTFLTVVVSFVALFVTIPNAINNKNEQTQVVIQPREGDIIVKDGDDYKLLQLINLSDISFPTKIQEKQFSKTESTKTRVNIPQNKEDWSNRDSFMYVINSFSINPNKVINLLDNIKSIMVYCDFYSEKNITTFIDLKEKAFFFTMRSSIEDLDFEVTKSNVVSEYEYVTNEPNDGIEWVKIRVEIVYQIGSREIIDTLTSDWIATDADIF